MYHLSPWIIHLSTSPDKNPDLLSRSSVHFLFITLKPCSQLPSLLSVHVCCFILRTFSLFISLRFSDFGFVCCLTACFSLWFMPGHWFKPELSQIPVLTCVLFTQYLPICLINPCQGTSKVTLAMDLLQSILRHQVNWSFCNVTNRLKHPEK